jgi:hypothetical protein
LSKDKSKETQEEFTSVSDLNLEAERVQEVPSKGFLGMFSNFSGAYKGNTTATSIKITFLMIVVIAGIVYYFQPSKTEQQANISTTVERRSTTTEKDAALLTQEAKERLEKEQAENFDRAMKRGETYVLNRHSLVDSTRPSEVEGFNPKAIYSKAYADAIARGMTEEEARKYAQDELYKAGIANGLSKERALQVLAEEEYRRTLESGLASGLTVRQAEEAARNAAMTAMINQGLSEEDAIEIVVKAIYADSYNKVIASGGTNEQALEKASKDAALAARLMGVDLLESRLMAARAAEDKARNDALINGISAAEVERIAIQALRDGGAAAGLRGDEALKNAVQSAYDKAYNQAIADGFSEEDARRMALEAAKNAALSFGLSEDEATRLSNETALSSGLSEDDLTRSLVRKDFLQEYKSGLTSSKSHEESLRSASIRANREASLRGMTQDKSQYLIYTLAYEAGYENKASADLTSVRATAGGESIIIAQSAINGDMLIAQNSSIEISYRYALSTDKALDLFSSNGVNFSSNSSYFAAKALLVPTQKAIEGISINTYKLLTEGNENYQNALILSGESAYGTTLIEGQDDNQALVNAAKNSITIGFDNTLPDQMIVFSALTVIYEKQLSKGQTSRLAIKKAIEIVSDLLVQRGIDNKRIFDLISAAALKLAGNDAVLAIKDLALSLGFSEEEANKLAIEAVRLYARESGKGRKDALISALEAAKLLGMSNEQILSYVNELFDEEGLSAEEKQKAKNALKKYIEVDVEIKAEVNINLAKQIKSIVNLALAKEKQEETNGKREEEDPDPVWGVASVLELDEEEVPKVETETSEQSTNVAEAKEILDEDKGILALKAGEFTYGLTLTNVNTDMGRSEVVAIIGGGLFDGARIIGSYDQSNNYGENVALVFTKIQYKSQVITEGVNLVAFDNTTGLPAFVDQVDRHYLQRVGSLLASGLAQGLIAGAEAKRSNTTTAGSTGGQTTATESATNAQTAAIVLGTAGTVLQPRIDELAARPITIKVFPGKEMRLLSLENVYLPLEEKNGR